MFELSSRIKCFLTHFLVSSKAQELLKKIILFMLPFWFVSERGDIISC